jgi:hypothetical protein
MITTTTPPGALAPLVEPREATPAEDATRADWLRVTEHLATLPGAAAANAWGVLGQYLEMFLTQAAVPRQRVPAGQAINRIEEV